MPFEMRENQELGILELHLYGRSKDDDYIQARDLFLAKAVEKNYKILFDLYELDINGSESTLRLFEIGNSLNGSIKEGRVGCLLPKEEYSRKDVLFAANMANHQGYLKMELFFTPQEARGWFS